MFVIFMLSKTGCICFRLGPWVERSYLPCHIASLHHLWSWFSSTCHFSVWSHRYPLVCRWFFVLFGQPYPFPGSWQSQTCRIKLFHPDSSPAPLSMLAPPGCCGNPRGSGSGPGCWRPWTSRPQGSSSQSSWESVYICHLSEPVGSPERWSVSRSVLSSDIRKIRIENSIPFHSKYFTFPVSNSVFWHLWLCTTILKMTELNIKDIHIKVIFFSEPHK